jgi:hypothetical protein
MFWCVSGAKAIIALRCCHLSDRFEGCRADRLCAGFHFYFARRKPLNIKTRMLNEAKCWDDALKRSALKTGFSILER